MDASHLDDSELVKSYELSLALTRQLGRAIRHRRERIQSIIDAVRRSSQADDEAAMNMGTPCGDVHPNYEGCTHECYVPPDAVELIERCGE